MKIEKITHGRWGQAYRLEHNSMEMIVITDVGPRIMSFRLNGGHNVLYEDNINFSRGDWHLYGGHRFWVGPETIRAFTPDNEPCDAEVVGDMLRIYQKPDFRGLQKIVEIAPSPDSAGFIIHHKLHTTIDLLSTGCIWVLTAVVPNRVLVPWGAGSREWQGNMVHYWHKWSTSSTNVESPQWRQSNDYFLIEPTFEVGKVGLYSERGFMALLRPDCTFIKRYPAIPGATYPDGGCNIELYTCKHFIEMETLSPLYTFYPGMEYTYSEQWLLTEKTYEPNEWAQIKSILPAGTDLLG